MENMNSPRPLHILPFGIYMLLVSLLVLWLNRFSLELALYGAAVLTGVLVLFELRYGYLLFLAMLPIHSIFFKLAPEKTTLLISDILLVALIIPVTANCLLKKRRFIDPNPSTFFILSFLMLAILTLLWTTNKFQGIYEIIRLFICIFGFYVTIYLLKDRNFFQLSMKTIIAAGAVTAIVSILSTFYPTIWWDYHIQLPVPLEFHNKFWFHHIGMPASISGRGMGFSVPHDTAYFCNIAIFFALGFLLNLTKKSLLWPLIAILLLLFAGMLSTLTKSTVIALWAGIGFMLLTIVPLKKKLLTCIAIVISLTLVMFFVSRIHEIGMSLKFTQHQLDANEKGSSVESRTQIWKMGLNKLIKTGGIGYGAGGYILNVELAVPDGTHPSILFDFGIIGFFIWIMIYLQGFLYFIRYLHISQNDAGKRFMTAYIGGYIMLLLSWMVTLHYDYVDIYLYLAIGYAISLAYGHETHTRSEFIFGGKGTDFIQSPLLMKELT